MNYNTQTDDRWKNDDMAAPGDKLNRWGCLVSVLSNIIQDYKRKIITPADLNNWIREQKLYFYDPPEQASMMKTDIVLERWGLKRLKDVEYIPNENYYYYARVTTSWGGHFINIVGKNKYYIGFDVWDGKLKTYSDKQIDILYRVERR